MSKFLGLLVGALSVATVATAETPWGGTEIGQAATSALAHLQEAEGEAAFKAVTGVSVERSTQGISAKAKVTYKRSSGSPATVSYFCHRHEEDEIDCH